MEEILRYPFAKDVHTGERKGTGLLNLCHN
jgi:hypothetical protein